MHTKPVHLDCNFIVDSTNAKGIASLNGGGIASVFMHTSTTPSSGNPNPAAGYIVVNFQDSFNAFYSALADIRSPNSGSDVKIDNSAMTAGQVYVITTLGNATLAKWQAIGVPVGTTPAVGVAFIALTNGGAGNALTSRVQTPRIAGAGISRIEVVGNPNMTIASKGRVVGGVVAGSQIILQCMGAAAMGTHAHDLLIKGGQAASTTNDIAVYTATLGKEAATDATVLGSASATLGGVLAASAGTPASLAVAPADGTTIDLSFLFSSSRITVQGD